MSHGINSGVQLFAKKKKKFLFVTFTDFLGYKYLYYGQFQQSHNAAKKKKRKKETELRVVTCAGGEGKEKWGDVGQRV